MRSGVWKFNFERRPTGGLVGAGLAGLISLPVGI